MTISQWSTTPANNASITDGTFGNINFVEGQAPSTVNDSVRSAMAHIRADYEAGGWTPLGHTAAYVGATQFKIAGVDVSAHYPVGRRVRAVASTPGTIYGRVSAVSFSTDTTVTVQWDSGSLSNEALVVSVGRMTSTGQPTPGDFLGAVNTAKGADVASATSTDIWAGAGNLVHITGTTTIEDFGTAPKAGAFRIVVFDDALTLTHGASAIVLPGGANIATAAGDIALVYADTTTKHLVTYVKADGTGVVPAVEAADQTEQEAGSATDVYTSPGTQHFHPSAAKAWVNFDGTAGSLTPRVAYNIASLTDNGTGTYQITFDEAFSSVNYVASGLAYAHASLNTLIPSQRAAVTPTATTFDFVTRALGGSDTDSLFVQLAFFGDQ